MEDLLDRCVFVRNRKGVASTRSEASPMVQTLCFPFLAEAAAAGKVPVYTCSPERSTDRSICNIREGNCSFYQFADRSSIEVILDASTSRAGLLEERSKWNLFIFFYCDRIVIGLYTKYQLYKMIHTLIW